MIRNPAILPLFLYGTVRACIRKRFRFRVFASIDPLSTIHWVSAGHAIEAEVRLYNPLLKTDLSKVPADHDWTTYLNPQSLERLTGCRIEPSLKGVAPGSRFQFERLGYFCVDLESKAGSLIFNRTVSLKDAWAKLEKGQPSR